MRSKKSFSLKHMASCSFLYWFDFLDCLGIAYSSKPTNLKLLIIFNQLNHVVENSFKFFILIFHVLNFLFYKGFMLFNLWYWLLLYLVYCISDLFKRLLIFAKRIDRSPHAKSHIMLLILIRKYFLNRCVCHIEQILILRQLPVQLLYDQLLNLYHLLVLFHFTLKIDDRLFYHLHELIDELIVRFYRFKSVS